MKEAETPAIDSGGTELIDTRLDGASLDVAVERRRELLELFPGARTEGDKIDFDRLCLALGESLDTGKERYGLTWPGKGECFKTIQAPSMATLLPMPEKSVNFDTTGNLIIEGDNLEVLKLLQKSYLGKVKMIYIDPPYNTGNDFIYPDDYAESLHTYLQYTGQVDAEGKQFGTNTDADGRFHSRWLSMMLPRIYLARNLLREDGAIFVSIGDEELLNLLALLNEIFGEENQVGIVTRVTKRSSNKGAHFAPSKDYVLMYARSTAFLPPLMDEQNAEYVARFQGRDQRGAFATVGLYQAALDSRPNQRYWVECPDGSLAIPPGKVFPLKQKDAAFVVPETNEDKVWRWSYESYLNKKDLLVFKKTAKSPLIQPGGERSRWNVYTKYYLHDRQEEGTRPRDFIDDITNDKGAAAMKSLGLDDVFAFAKPVELMQRCLGWLDDPEGVCLDFFAGSGTTAQAVLDLNAKDGGERKFILVQLPEPTGRNDYATIADIAEERTRRVIAKLDQADAEKLNLEEAKPDRGFRVFKLAESNVKAWDTSIPHEVSAVESQLDMNIDHLRHDRSDLDVLYEVVLKSGYPLSAKVSHETIDGKRIYSVADGAFVICLERNLTFDLIRAIAARKPERVLFLDEGFAGNDQLKTNAVQTFKTKNVVFRTL